MDTETTENFELRVKAHGLESAVEWARVRYDAHTAGELRFAYHQKGIDGLEDVARCYNQKGRR